MASRQRHQPRPPEILRKSHEHRSTPRSYLIQQERDKESDPRNYRGEAYAPEEHY